MNILHHYDNNHLPNSAAEVVPFIIKIIQPKSVVDVGCGLGQWLKTFNDLGVEDILGIDGEHVPKDQLYISKNQFRAFDLRKGEDFFAGRKYDLAISLEVAEHIEPEYADGFIHMLVNLSDIIIFSAAIPNQTGENHYNEQYPSYWRSKFSKYQYSFLDPFREKYWNNDNINWWYRQNMYLVVSDNIIKRFGFNESNNIYIHPKLFELQVQMVSNLQNKYENIGIKESLKLLFKALKKLI